jgi:raffinose/stachyose/melibiose transport system substrate-binding protein
MKRRDFLRSVGAAGLALSAPLSIAACGGSSTGATPGGNQKVTINWWHINTDTPTKTAWQNIATQYMKAHPNVNIKITIIENDSFKTKLATDMQSGNPPDLFHSWGGGVLFQFAQAGLVKDITSDLQGDWGNSFSKPALNVYAQNGKYYGVPWDMGAVTFWYNKTLFAKAGITQPPGTWNQFLQVVQQLKGAGITPIALGEGDKWPGHYYWAYLAMRVGGKEPYLKAVNRTGTFTDPSFVQAGTLLRQLVALNPFEKGFLGTSYNDETTIMGNGKAAMELQGQWAPNNDKSAATSKTPLDLDFFPFPAVEGGAGLVTDVFGGGGGFAIGKNAPPETVDFLKVLTDVQNQTTMGKAGLLLPTVTAAASAMTDPLRVGIAKLVADATYFQLYYDQALPPAIGTAVLDATQGLYAGTVTPQAAAQQVESEAATSLQGS